MKVVSNSQTFITDDGTTVRTKVIKSTDADKDQEIFALGDAALQFGDDINFDDIFSSFSHPPFGNGNIPFAGAGAAARLPISGLTLQGGSDGVGEAKVNYYYFFFVVVEYIKSEATRLVRTMSLLDVTFYFDVSKRYRWGW